jgi:hypothetical protein
VFAFLVLMISQHPGRIDRQSTWLRVCTTTLIAFVTVANLLAAGRLVGDIVTSSKTFEGDAAGLLGTGGVVWATNIIAFALWYWNYDRGGAAARAHHPDADPSFVFPEMQQEKMAATWTPIFADYLTLGFWTATAFSPSDVSAITRWAKLVMMTEAAVSLVIGALVIARAINVL